MNIIRNNKFKELVHLLKSVHSHDIDVYQSKSSNKLINFKEFHKLGILIELNLKLDHKEKKNKNPQIDHKKNYDKKGIDNDFDKCTTTNSSIKFEENSNKHIDNRKKNLEATDIGGNLPKSLYNFIGYDFISINNHQFDSYAKIYMKSIDPIFRSLSDKKYIENLLKHLKIKLIDIFNKQEFYQKYEFSTKDFKKSELEETFMTNLPITLYMLKIFANIFDTNLIYKNLNQDKSTYQYLNNFISNRVTVILFDYDNKIFSIVPKNGNYIRGEDLAKYLGYKNSFTEPDLLKCNLDKIQNLSKMKNICIKKQGKTGKINKKKEDLIKEILNS